MACLSVRPCLVPCEWLLRPVRGGGGGVIRRNSSTSTRWKKPRWPASQRSRVPANFWQNYEAGMSREREELPSINIQENQREERGITVQKSFPYLLPNAL